MAPTASGGLSGPGPVILSCPKHQVWPGIGWLSGWVNRLVCSWYQSLACMFPGGQRLAPRHPGSVAVNVRPGGDMSPEPGQLALGWSS